MTFRTILTDTRDDVAAITLNRPERMNAWTYEMAEELAQAVLDFDADDAIGAIVLTGAGRAFCAGADVQDVFQAQSDGATFERSAQAQDWVGLVRRAKPMVAALNGATIGLGLTQILPMDHLVAARGARISCRFVKMGVVPELASSRFLFARCGHGHASELMLSGRTLDADEALAIGLVDRVVEPDRLVDEAIAVARSMGENPHAALRAIKDLITRNANETDLVTVQKRELEALNAAYATAEHQEAIAAFLGKRAPDFRKARESG